MSNSPASDQSYQDAILEFKRAGPSGFYRRIVQVAYLRAMEEGVPGWAWLEETILRFKRAVDTSYSSFAASASYARAIAHYGVVDDRPLRDCLEELDPDCPSFADSVLTKVSEVNREQASRTRRATGLRAEGTRWGETYPALKAVQTIVELANQGDPAATRELELIRTAVLPSE